MQNQLLSRRLVVGGLATATLAPQLIQETQAQAAMLRRPIPHGGGETLPAIGLGTSIVFDVGASPQDRAGPDAVVHALIAGGGSLIDSAPSYGQAEAVVGDILAASGLRRRPLSPPSSKNTGPAARRRRRAGACNG